MGVFTLGAKLFSKVQQDDGSWARPVLVPMPANQNRARQDNIFSALLVPSPFRRPEQIAAAQEALLKDHDISVSEDGKGASIDIFAATSRAFQHARSNNNYIPPSAQRGARAQILADGVTYYRMGRMATRFGTRVLGLKRWFNAKYYFSNVSLYLNGDHFAELKKYLGHVYDKLNEGQRTAPNGVDEVGNAQFTSSLHTTSVRCGASEDDIVELEWTEGGDAAAGNSIGNMEAPPRVSWAAATIARVGAGIGSISVSAQLPSAARSFARRCLLTRYRQVHRPVHRTRALARAARSSSRLSLRRQKSCATAT